MALCAIHHKLFDFGAIAIDNDFKLIVSEKVQGSNINLNPLLAKHQEFISKPLEEKHIPNKEYIAWHISEVYKS